METKQDIQRLFVNNSTTIHEALKKLSETALGVLLLIDKQGCLERTATDGDIRRLLLNQPVLEQTLALLPAKKPVTIKDPINFTEALKLMNDLSIDHLPVIDEFEKPISLLSRKELNNRILLSTPHMSELEIEFIEEAFRTNWIAPLGPNVDNFEKEVCTYTGASAAVALSSGTAAIHLALRLLGVGHQDSVFCSSFTFVASASPILYQAAEPVFIDAEPESWNLSPKALERAFATAKQLGKMPKALVLVNIYGQSADMTPILEMCDHYNVPVIEDAAESLGATYKGKYSGTFGKLGVFSFNGNKIITTSGGGLLLSEDKSLIEKARFLSTQARDVAPHYEHSELGYNYRMSNVLAGIGLGQLKVLDDRIAKRRDIFDCYAEALADIEAIQWMPEANFGRSTRWLTTFCLDPRYTNITPENFMSILSKEGIETRPVWKPLHLQPLFKGTKYFSHETGHSVCETLFARGICLPSGSNLSNSQQARIIEVIRKIFGASPRS